MYIAKPHVLCGDWTSMCPCLLLVTSSHKRPFSSHLQYSWKILKHLCAFPLPWCWFGHYSHLSAPKYIWLNIEEGEGLNISDILWNDLTIKWNDLAWNDLSMEQSDQIEATILITNCETDTASRKFSQNFLAFNHRTFFLTQMMGIPRSLSQEAKWKSVPHIGVYTETMELSDYKIEWSGLKRSGHGRNWPETLSCTWSFL